jgi:UDP-glucose 4-epimerase
VIVDIRGKKFVVIGGAGLIGSHTVDALTREDVREVVIYDNFCRGTHENLAQALRDPRVRIFEIGGDVCQTDILEAALTGADGVFHLAALWLLQCHDFPRSGFDVNIRGTFNVLEACVKLGVGRLVYSSSASVYGDAVEEPMTEDHPFNNRNFYGATKIAGEAMARAFHHRYGLNYCGLRYMNVYGPRQDYQGVYITVIMKMLDAIERGEGPMINGDGSEAFDFVDVDDCAQANLCAMKSDSVDRFYNVGTGKRTTLRELADMLLRLTGSNQSVNYAASSRKTLVRNRIGDPRRAQKDIGFVATIPFDRGLRRVIEWRSQNVAELAARRARASA